MKSFINNIAALACLVLALNVTSTHLRSYELHHEKTDFLHICEKKDADQLHCYFNAFVELHR